ncbi:MULTISPECIES: aldehyde dehydrogenase family protein [Mumia]|uniref:aldehyde dehydrogenase family protein n=1 Tax=Mumia TaxID=1546255 RepID=UPI0014212886|nr:MULTISPECIES: aldehyde dehydrogenase family protein [unclassified Mumia]QMW65387.1 aldehyde dehydrogenase family protein [Mumia sp. ZJ1417]
MTAQPVPYRSVNPATGVEVRRYETATDAQVSDALDAADAAYRAWSRLTVADRAERVAAFGRLFAERADELAAIAAEEMGKSVSEAAGEARFSGDIFAYYADNAATLLADQPLTVSGDAEAVVQRRPIGVVLGIMPWNYPFYQVARFAAPNLVLGNTVLLKHAESVPRSAEVIAELASEAGLPDGVYTNVFASHDQVGTIIDDPRVQGVSLTGSERAGSAVAARAGAALKKCVLELGGSDPYIVLDTDDVAAAAQQAWSVRVSNMGQACNANKRMIVHESIADAFVAELTALAEGLVPGDPTDPTPGTYRPLSSRAAAESLAAQIQDAVDKGATLHAGGTLEPGPAAYLAPAVLSGVTPQMRAYAEELFGPVAVVYSVRDEDEAVALANASAYGLGGAVFSADAERARRVADRLEVGMANVNTPAGEGTQIPFGGVKRSGFGRELGPLGIDEFANKRVFYVER